MMTRRGWGVLGAALLLGPALAFAGEEMVKDRLSLTVRGKATAPADEVAIEVTVTGNAEEAVEAERKYRDKLNRVLNALGKGDGKASEDGDSPKKKKPKKKDEEPKKKGTEEEDEDAPKPKKKKPAATDEEDEDAPKPKKKKPAATDEDEDAPKPKKKPDASDKGDAPKGDAPKGDAPKGDAPKGDAPKADEKLPFVVDVKEGGLTFGIKGGDANQQRMRRMMGQQGGKEEPEFRFSSQLTIAFKSVAKADPKALRKRIAEVLDKVSEAGADTAVGPEGDGTPPMIRFAVADAEELKQHAYTEAMGNARKRGASLASLSDRALGKVTTLRDQTALPQVNHRPQYNYQYGYVQQVGGQLGEDWSTEVIVEVDLYVEFELRDKPAADKK